MLVTSPWKPRSNLSQAESPCWLLSIEVAPGVTTPEGVALLLRSDDTWRYLDCEKPVGSVSLTQMVHQLL